MKGKQKNWTLFWKPAPTGAGTQAPVIVAVQDVDTVAAPDAMNAKVLGSASMHPYYGAPTILLVMAPKEDTLAEVDCALVGGNLLNAAYAVGLGPCWIHRCKEMFESEEGKKLLKKWNLPETMQGICSIALSDADCPHPDAKGRKSDYIVKV